MVIAMVRARESEYGYGKITVWSDISVELRI